MIDAKFLGASLLALSVIGCGSPEADNSDSYGGNAGTGAAGGTEATSTDGSSGGTSGATGSGGSAGSSGGSGGSMATSGSAGAGGTQGGECTTAQDCTLWSTCCGCLGLAEGETEPACEQSSCVQNECESLGIEEVQCIAGKCTAVLIP